MAGMCFQQVATHRVVVRRTFLEVICDESEFKAEMSQCCRKRASSVPCKTRALGALLHDGDLVPSSDRSQSPKNSKTESVATTQSWADSWDEVSDGSDGEPASAPEAKNIDGRSCAASARLAEIGVEITDCTSVMFRNLPKKLTQSDFLQTLNAEGFLALYDFAYLPINFQKRETYGYAVVNFINHIVADHAMKLFEKFVSWPTVSRRASTTIWNSPGQGVVAHVERYRNSPLMHPDVPQDLKPMLFSCGFQVQFPPATKQLKAPPGLPKRKIPKCTVRISADGTARAQFS